MNTADFFLKVTGGKEAARGVVESIFDVPLEGFLAALDQADAEERAKQPAEDKKP